MIKIKYEKDESTIPSLTVRRERDGMGVKKLKAGNDGELLASQQMYFDRCVDFLATMMVKYGAEIQLPMPENVNLKADDAGENVA